jgi:ABC-type taurine transport system ATPase subunit
MVGKPVKQHTGLARSHVAVPQLIWVAEPIGASIAVAASTGRLSATMPPKALT